MTTGWDGTFVAKQTVHVPVRWGDLDPYGHVNNVAMFSLLEEARIAAFWSKPTPTPDSDEIDPKHPESQDRTAEERVEAGHHIDHELPTAILGAGTTGSTLTFVASHHIEYISPLGHKREPARIDLWISTIGGASIDLDYQVIDGDTVCVNARTVLVMIDPETNRPRRITPQERAVWQQATAAPLVFRR